MIDTYIERDMKSRGMYKEFRRVLWWAFCARFGGKKFKVFVGQLGLGKHTAAAYCYVIAYSSCK